MSDFSVANRYGRLTRTSDAIISKNRNGLAIQRGFNECLAFQAVQSNGKRNHNNSAPPVLHLGEYPPMMVDSRIQ